MTKQKTNEVKLTERDNYLLRVLCDVGFLKLDQIADHVFKTSYKNASRRLIMLRDAKLIRFIWRQDYSGTRVYIPNFAKCDPEDGEAYYERYSGKEKYLPWFNKNYEHEDTVRTWALRASTLRPDYWLKMDYTLEPEIWDIDDAGPKERRKRPDFILLAHKDRSIAFEIELNPKSRWNYHVIFANILKRQGTSFIYLAKNKAIKEKVQKCLDETIADFEKYGERFLNRIMIFEFSELKTQDQLASVIERAEKLRDAELPREIPSDMKPPQIRRLLYTDPVTNETKIKEIPGTRPAQLDTASPQTPPSLQYERKGFAGVQQDEPGEKEEPKNLNGIFKRWRRGDDES